MSDEEDKKTPETDGTPPMVDPAEKILHTKPMNAQELMQALRETGHRGPDIRAVMEKAMHPEKVPFRCRVCGCTSYSDITKSNGIIGPGHHLVVTGHKCDECSALFADPAKFSR